LYYRYLIIDAQNLYWRAVSSSLKKCIDDENVEVYSNSIQNFLERINDLQSMFAMKESEMYLLFDNPLSIINKRKSIDVEYKHSRDEKYVPKNFYKTLDKLQEILRVYKNNLYIVKYDGLEADDLVVPVLENINKTGNQDEKLVISADMDWARAIGVDNNCSWHNYLDTYDNARFLRKYAFSPAGKNIQMYKAIHGDNSDSVPNAVPYLPKEILLYIVENFNDIDSLFKEMWNHQDRLNQWIQKIKEAEKRIRINYRLVDYVTQNNLQEFIFKCSENILMLRFWFNNIGIQFESKMFNKDEDLFFEQKKYKKIKNKR
jgi:hypothetical protein